MYWLDPLGEKHNSIPTTSGLKPLGRMVFGSRLTYARSLIPSFLISLTSPYDAAEPGTWECNSEKTAEVLQLEARGVEGSDSRSH